MSRTAAGQRIPLFDWCFVIFGGLPFVLPFVFLMGESGLARREPVYWYYWMNACISAPHVYATYCRLARKIREGRVWWSVGWPGYGVCVGGLVMASAHGMFLHAMTAVNVWQSVHYVRQVYGVARIYARQAVEDGLTRRLSFLGFHLAMPLFVLGRWDTLYVVWGGNASEAIIPVNVSDTIMHACWVLAAASGFLGIAGEYRRYRQAPCASSLLSIANLGVYFSIFLFGFLSAEHYQRGFFAVTIYHAVQYLALVWKLERQKAKGWLSQAIIRLPQVATFLIFWAALFVLGIVFERMLLPRGGTIWVAGPTILLAAVSAHHYAVDTVIWRREAGL